MAANHTTGHGYSLALVAEGRDPDPVAVLHTADNQPTEEFTNRPPANDWALPDRGSRHHEFALYLADAYSQVVDPHHLRAYAGEVLADAYRRTFRFHGHICISNSAKAMPPEAISLITSSRCRTSSPT